MKFYILSAFAVFMMIGCNKPPIAVEIKDVCAQPTGTNVIIQGYVSLPREMEVTKYTRGGQGVSMNYKLFMMTKADATGDSVASLFSATGISEPNKIKTLPDKYTWNDLLAYTDDGKQVPAGKVIKVTGEVLEDEKTKCKVSVRKIEIP